MMDALRRISNLFLGLFLILSLTSGALALDITSTPDYEVEPLHLWEYNITSDNDWVGNLTVTSTLGNGLVLLDWNLSYLPTEDDIGVYIVNITLHDTIDEVETYSWQNFTLTVTPVTPINHAFLAIGLAFAFGLTVMGMVDRTWMFLGGIVWIYSSLAVFIDFGYPWMMMGFAVGLVTLGNGILALAERRNN